MTDPPRYPDAGDNADVGPDHGAPPRVPRWVKVSAIVVGILVLLFVILRFAGIGGEHGPGQHALGGDARPPGVTEGGIAEGRGRGA